MKVTKAYLMGSTKNKRCWYLSHNLCPILVTDLMPPFLLAATGIWPPDANWGEGFVAYTCSNWASLCVWVGVGGCFA